MYKVEKETIENAYKPFDVVTNDKGDVGIIKEVCVNDCQPGPEDQISYSVRWIVGDETKVAWFDHHELKSHTNIFVEIAKSACHPMGTNEKWISMFFDTKAYSKYETLLERGKELESMARNTATKIWGLINPIKTGE